MLYPSHQMAKPLHQLHMITQSDSGMPLPGPGNRRSKSAVMVIVCYFQSGRYLKTNGGLLSLNSSLTNILIRVRIRQYIQYLCDSRWTESHLAWPSWSAVFINVLALGHDPTFCKVSFATTPITTQKVADYYAPWLESWRVYMEIII